MGDGSFRITRKTYFAVPAFLYVAGIDLSPVERHFLLAFFLGFFQPCLQTLGVKSAVCIVAAELLQFGVQEEGDFRPRQRRAKGECCGLYLRSC